MKYCAHDYQAYATEFVLSHPYCGLILDMGLGKSVITLTALWDLLLDSFDVGPSVWRRTHGRGRLPSGNT